MVLLENGENLIGSSIGLAAMGKAILANKQCVAVTVGHIGALEGDKALGASRDAM